MTVCGVLVGSRPSLSIPGLLRGFRGPASPKRLDQVPFPGGTCVRPVCRGLDVAGRRVSGGVVRGVLDGGVAWKRPRRAGVSPGHPPLEGVTRCVRGAVASDFRAAAAPTSMFES